MSASRSPDLRGIAAARDGSHTLAGNSKRNGNFATLGKKHHRFPRLVVATGRIARAMAGLGSSNVANTLLQTLQNLNAQVRTRPLRSINPRCLPI